MGSHTVTCHPTEVRIQLLPPAEAGTRFSDPGAVQGWGDLCYVKADRPGIEPATYKSQVQCPTAEPPRNTPRQANVESVATRRCDAGRRRQCVCDRRPAATSTCVAVWRRQSMLRASETGSTTDIDRFVTASSYHIRPTHLSSLSDSLCSPLEWRLV